jgi:uncharacterized caspase-like protein
VKLISSAELTQWLRKVDAGQMVMIIDACYAADVANSGQEEFKPGPMGDRGLGQLAYDKKMRILAATQAGNVALESDKLGEGLLTYALVQDGLKLHKADLQGVGTITLQEWLQYGEQRVPELYEDIRRGKLQLTRKGEIITGKALQMTTTEAQTPELFDFASGLEVVTAERKATQCSLVARSRVSPPCRAGVAHFPTAPCASPPPGLRYRAGCWPRVCSAQRRRLKRPRSSPPV